MGLIGTFGEKALQLAVRNHKRRLAQGLQAAGVQPAPEDVTGGGSVEAISANEEEDEVNQGLWLALW